MNHQNQNYLCLKPVGDEYQLQPAGRNLPDPAREGAGQVWYFITARPLEEFSFLRCFRLYRDLQAAYSAMALVDPLIQRAGENNSL